MLSVARFARFSKDEWWKPALSWLAINRTIEDPISSGTLYQAQQSQRPTLTSYSRKWIGWVMIFKSPNPIALRAAGDWSYRVTFYLFTFFFSLFSRSLTLSRPISFSFPAAPMPSGLLSFTLILYFEIFFEYSFFFKLRILMSTLLIDLFSSTSAIIETLFP